MTLQQLQAFMEARKGGSFTAAARSLGLTQPSVSELVRRLEDELGMELFRRAGRGLVSTLAGDELAPFAEQALAAADQGVTAVRALRDLEGGTATFGLLRNAEFYALSELALRFHRRHPSVRVRLVGQNSTETAAAVQRGEIEAGMVTLPVDHEGLAVTPLVRDEVVYITADAGRAATPRTIADVATAPMILYDAHYGDTDPARRQLATRARLSGVSIEPLIEVEHLASALTLVQAGVGDTLACRAAVASATFPVGLHVARFAEPMYDTIALVTRRGHALSPATRELARFAQQTLFDHARGPHGTTTVIARTDARRAADEHVRLLAESRSMPISRTRVRGDSRS
ncbi:LysR family transcriptional regulator [Nonomuraea sp. KM88]|uniref:LysR family transcriptional regulator n=1 Tax=Nonomuraea sp. KM88 TaxID=3457427 RepID=UPI003FCC5F98